MSWNDGAVVVLLIANPQGTVLSNGTRRNGRRMGPRKTWVREGELVIFLFLLKKAPLPDNLEKNIPLRNPVSTRIVPPLFRDVREKKTRGGKLGLSDLARLLACLPELYLFLLRSSRTRISAVFKALPTTTGASRKSCRKQQPYSYIKAQALPTTTGGSRNSYRKQQKAAAI